MQQLKFKAWHKENQELLFGTAGKDGGLVFVKPVDMYADDRDETGYRNKDLIIMQFTGIKDITGREIYEGDFIIDSERPQPQEVIYNSQTATFEPLNILDLQSVKVVDSKYKMKF